MANNLQTDFTGQKLAARHGKVQLKLSGPCLNSQRNGDIHNDQPFQLHKLRSAKPGQAKARNRACKSKGGMTSLVENLRCIVAEEVSERVKYVQLKFPRHLSGSSEPKSVRIAMRRGPIHRHTLFARIADSIDGKVDELVETAENLRVPVPAATLPFLGRVKSLVVKQLLCGILAGAVASTAVAPFYILRTRVMAGQGGLTSGQVLNTVIQEKGLQSLMQVNVTFNIICNAFEKGLQFATFEGVKRLEIKKKGKETRLLPLPRSISISTTAGAAGGFIGAIVTYPLQVISNKLILQPDQYPSLLKAAEKVVKTEGWKELFRGITPHLISIVPQAAASFYTYETLKENYLRKYSVKDLDNLASLVIGGIAGAVSASLTYPLEEISRHIVYANLSSSAVHLPGGPVDYNNMWQAFKGIVKKEGIGGLYRGLPLKIVQIVPYTALTFVVYEAAKRALVAVGEESKDEVKVGENPAI